MGKRYICTDLHGQYKLWEQIKAELAPDDTLICLGDCFDRGDRGYDILSEMIADPRIMILKGNHEDMFTEGFNEGYYKMGIPFEKMTPNTLNDTLWFYNGGEYTYYNMEHLTEQEMIDLVKTIESFPIHLTIVNDKGYTLELSHSGFDPWRTDEEYEETNFRFSKFKDSRYIWDRAHLNREEWKGGDQVYVIHGHTPVQKVSSKSDECHPEILYYCEGHKIDLDLCSAITGRAALFDLDTFEVKYFEAKITGMFA